MVKARVVIEDALEDILNLVEEEPVGPGRSDKCLRYLNEMMAMFSAKGVKLGYTQLTNIEQDVTVPDGALVGIKAHLSIYIASKFDKKPDEGVYLRAKAGWLAMLELMSKSATRVYPSILPVGSGNRHYTPFFSGDLNDIYTSPTGGLSILDV